MIDYDNLLNTTASTLPFSGIRKFFALATKPGCLSLGVGEPDFATPIEFCQSAFRRIENGETHYTDNLGLYELRKAISKYLKGFIGIEYNPDEEIVVTNGASEALDVTLRAICNVGDEVIVPEPNFVAYTAIASLCGAVPVRISCTQEERFALTAKKVEDAITSKTKCIVLAYPNNPTGAVLSKDELQAIANLAIKHNLLVISDEIYGELIYDDATFTSISTLDGMRERTIVISGFSKIFAMTGWRIGYVCAPPEIAIVVKKLHQYCAMCAPTPSQQVALGALECSFENGFKQVNEMNRAYTQRRACVIERLQEIGLDCVAPQGTFYCFPSVKSTGLTGEEFATRLLLQHNVAVVPGDAFGECGKDHIRIAFASSIDTLNQAFDRMQTFVNELKNNH